MDCSCTTSTGLRSLLGGGVASCCLLVKLRLVQSCKIARELGQTNFRYFSFICSNFYSVLCASNLIIIIVGVND